MRSIIPATNALPDGPPCMRVGPNRRKLRHCRKQPNRPKQIPALPRQLRTFQEINLSNHTLSSFRTALSTRSPLFLRLRGEKGSGDRGADYFLGRALAE